MYEPKALYREIRDRNKRDFGERRHITAAHLIEQYPEPTALIPELLQNADDAEASDIGFKVFQEGLLVWNNGRSFDEQNVRSISGLWYSHKDLTALGYFGIGFKSVLAVTENPCILSNPYHFHLKSCIDPYEVDEVPVIIEPFIEKPVVFWLPWRLGLDWYKACNNLEACIKEKRGLFLLFSKNLKRCAWESPDGHLTYQIDSRVIWERGNDRAAEKVWEISLKSEDGNSQWLRLDQKELLPEEVVKAILDYVPQELRPDLEPRLLKSINAPVTLSFAFMINEKEILVETEGHAFAMIPIQDTGLRFHLNSRFPTTISRSQIRLEDPLTKWLFNRFVEMTRILPHRLREIGWLRPSSWNVVPKRGEAQKAFQDIAEAFRYELVEGAFFPGEDGTDHLFDRVFLAHHQDLYELLNISDLQEITSQEYAVFTHPELRIGRRADVARSLGVKEVSSEEVVSWLEQKAQKPDGLAIRKKDWFWRLYRYLDHLYQQSSLRQRIQNLPVLRLRNGCMVCLPAFFPPKQGEVEPELEPYLEKFPILDPSLSEDEIATRFLRTLGVQPFDLVRLLDVFLKQYENIDSKPSPENNLQHLRLLFRLWKAGKVSQLQWTKWKEIPFLRDRVGKYVSPSHAYLPAKYGGSREVEEFLRLSSERSFVALDYPQTRENAKEWGEFLEVMGVSRLPRFSIYSIEGWSFFDEMKKRGFEYQYSTRGHVLNDWNIDGFEEVLKKLKSKLTLKVVKSVWVTMAYLSCQKKMNECTLCGWRHEKSLNKSYLFWFYYNCFSDKRDALWLKRLKELAWLPDERGQPKRPNELFDPNLKPALGPELDYMNNTIPIKTVIYREFADLLGVHLEPDATALLRYLRALCESGANIDPKMVQPVYEKLAELFRGKEEERETIIEAFEAPLILIPGQGWYHVSEVCWYDPVGVIPALKKTWNIPTLREFFVEYLDVPEGPSPDGYARTLLRLAEGEPWKPSKLRPIYRMIEEGYAQDGLSQDLWDKLKEAPCWLGRHGDRLLWWRAKELVWNDHKHLATLFRNQLIFWAMDKFLELAQALEVVSLSKAVVCFSSSGERLDQISNEELRRLWPYVVRFINTFLESQGDTSLYESPFVKRADQLEVRYEILGILSEPDPEGNTVYDPLSRAVLLDSSVEYEDVPDAVGDALEQALSVQGLREFIKDLWGKKGERLHSVLRRWEKRSGIALTPEEEQPQLKKMVIEGTKEEAEGIKEETDAIKYQPLDVARERTVSLPEPTEIEFDSGIESKISEHTPESIPTQAVEPIINEFQKLPVTETPEPSPSISSVQEAGKVLAPEISVDFNKEDLVKEVEDIKQLLSEGKNFTIRISEVWKEAKEIDKVSSEARIVVSPFVSASSKKNWEPRILDSEKVFVEAKMDPTKIDAVRSSIKAFRERMRKIIEIMGGNPDTVNVCIANPETDGDRREGQLFFNVLRNDKPLRWVIVAARELAYVKFPKPSQAHISLMTDLIEKALERINDIYPEIFTHR